MEATVIELVKAHGALTKISKVSIKNQKLFYWVVVSLRKMKNCVSGYHETNERILPKYATYDQPKDLWLFNGVEERRQYNVEIKPVQDEKETVDVKPRNLSDFLAEERLNLTPELVDDLGPFVVLDLTED